MLNKNLKKTDTLCVGVGVLFNNYFFVKSCNKKHDLVVEYNGEGGRRERGLSWYVYTATHSLHWSTVIKLINQPL